MSHTRTRPIEIVTIGGGTGLATLLRGLKRYVHHDGTGPVRRLSAIVTVTDEGGSSGVLRKELSMLPPGDVRNCIVALAEEEHLLSQLFDYRFESDSALKGHSLGNLLLAALTDIKGGFDAAILAASEVLAIRGAIYPSTLSDVRLRALCADGSVLVGETAISGDHLVGSPPPHHAPITSLTIEPSDVEPVDDALEAIDSADVVAIGPGSLYTSVLPNLLIDRLRERLRDTSATRVYICNVMTQPGETDGYTAGDHLRAIIDHAGDVVDIVVINRSTPSRGTLDAYAAHGQFPVEFDEDEIRALGAIPSFADMICEGNFLRHDPDALAEALFRIHDDLGSN